MGRRDQHSIPVVHAVTSDDVVRREDFVVRAQSVMEALGARGAVHLRATALSGARLFRLAELLAQAQRKWESWLIVNDRLDVALAVGARGVQLTSRSIAVSDAVPIASGMAVGASVHSLPEARAAEVAGASWIVAGHVYATASHPAERGRGEDFVAEIAWRLSIPIIAIGGILPPHVAALRKSGAFGVAVIRGIWSADDPAAAASDYLYQYDANGDR